MAGKHRRTHSKRWHLVLGSILLVIAGFFAGMAAAGYHSAPPIPPVNWNFSAGK